MHLRTTGLIASTSLVLIATAMTGAPAQGHHPKQPAPSPSPAPPALTTVASGLDNPRLLSFDGETLYVAESGRGGTGPCTEGPEGGTTCFGATGAVTSVTTHRTKVRHASHGRHRGHPQTRWQTTTKQQRVLTGLPSAAGPDGGGASGPADVLVDGNKYTLSLGLGGGPEARTALGPDAALLGTVATGRFASQGKHGKHHWYGKRSGPRGPRVLADLVAFEAANNPEPTAVDSNPTSIELSRNGFLAVDAGGNSLLQIKTKNKHWSSRGHHPAKVGVLATFPPTTPPGAPGPMDAVPTSVAQGPDGALYVSQLTGFPFPKGGASIFRVVPGQAPTVHATGLTNVTDLAWYRGQLYVVQIADEGLLGGPPGELPVGSLRRINRDGSSTAVAAGLPAPYGVALKDSAAYVTTCGMCAGGGSVVKIPLR